ncbi:thiamine phosphate synthase [Desulfonema magnum]|uniref:Thiamine-phosphate synthase n=1 Tax=Desulfonema magnum TaxID=45655 RepID=A0A975BH87_9BACT|nr:thiamine phosphate synthase [Desulfonema magnum]QTA85278.1 Thiamine-phosphate synthase [Desulfonema magnum]
MKKKAADYSLYLVTDRGLSRGRTTPEIVQAAVRGGVTCVQLREKNCSPREFIEQAILIQKFLKEHHIPLIINDRVDVAQAVKADGVHLGQSDMPLEMAKAILKDSMIIGISAQSVQHAVEAEKKGADYIGVGTIYPTLTKDDTSSPLGTEGLREIRKNVKIPIVAIGGLNKENSGDVIQNGADGIAVVSAIVSADDPEQTARELREIITGAKTS